MDFYDLDSNRYLSRQIVEKCRHRTGGRKIEILPVGGQELLLAGDAGVWTGNRENFSEI
jgi:hypothetical protein